MILGSSIDVNLVTVIVTAIPATLAAIASFIQAIRNGNKLDQHGQEMSRKIDNVADAVNGRMDEAIHMANAQGRIDEQQNQKKKESVTA
jgi:hypothetical protein